MSERPGPHIGPPRRQHQIMAMLWLLSTSRNKEEAQSFLVALEAAVEYLWGWDEHQLKADLIQCEQAMKEYQGRMTFWFSKEGAMQFDYHCTPPKQ